MDTSHDIPEDELAERVVYALLRPAVRLASAFGLPLKHVVGLLESAYFHELRRSGFTLREAGDRLQVSQRTTVRLAKDLRERFVQPELEHNLPRRIEFMLWARPMSEARLCQVLPEVDADEIHDALGMLLGEGRIEVRAGRAMEYAPVSNLRKLPRDTWMRRLGGLNTLVDNVADATFGRFFRDEPRTFARSLSFQLPRGGTERLRRWYEESVLPHIVELSDEATGDDVESVQLSLCWAPYEFIREAAGDESAHERTAQGAEDEGETP